MASDSENENDRDGDDQQRNEQERRRNSRRNEIQALDDDSNSSSSEDEDSVQDKHTENSYKILKEVENPNQKARLYEFIGQMRKYDGLTDAREFIARFVDDINQNGIEVDWAIRNFDRALVGDASSWWNAKWPKYSSKINKCANEDEKMKLWKCIYLEFFRYFDHSSQQATWRQKNKQLKFYLGESSQKYVMAKLEVLRNIDPKMRESKKIHELIRGLPMEIQTPMVLQSIRTCDDFLGKLRRLSEAHFLTNGRSRKEKSAIGVSEESIPTPFMGQFQGKERSSRHEKNHSWRNKSNQSKNEKKSQFKWTEDGKPICDHCSKVGHFKRNCYALNGKNSGNNNNYKGNRNGRSSQNFKAHEINNDNGQLLQVLESIKEALNPAGPSSAATSKELQQGLMTRGHEEPMEDSMPVFSSRSWNSKN